MNDDTQQFEVAPQDDLKSYLNDTFLMFCFDDKTTGDTIYIVSIHLKGEDVYNKYFENNIDLREKRQLANISYEVLVVGYNVTKETPYIDSLNQLNEASKKSLKSDQMDIINSYKVDDRGLLIINVPEAISDSEDIPEVEDLNNNSNQITLLETEDMIPDNNIKKTPEFKHEDIELVDTLSLDSLDAVLKQVAEQANIEQKYLDSYLKDTCQNNMFIRIPSSVSNLILSSINDVYSRDLKKINDSELSSVEREKELKNLFLIMIGKMILYLKYTKS